MDTRGGLPHWPPPNGRLEVASATRPTDFKANSKMDRDKLKRDLKRERKRERERERRRWRGDTKNNPAQVASMAQGE